MDHNIILVVIDKLGLVILFFGLFIGWSNPFARWLVISYLLLELIDLTFYQMTKLWNTHFYIFEAFMCLVYMLPILFRRDITLFLYQRTHSRFFLTVAKRKGQTKYEIYLLKLLALTTAVNFITWIEVLCYKYWLIDIPYIKLYFRDYFIYFVLLCQNIALYAFIMYCYASESAPDLKRQIDQSPSIKR
ncbi:hypothetical protein N473_14810 [Pseudoalteromonas luteoviolacea CPMOR-1]|uniref:Uncharacterized protein n=1 Tax=Pseudoalteromonas luteoviolacea CPMOR-1 TaxID=1365248 RepID=A0A167LIE0_9GAMM|nr:hypothetical protein N473_14810 [Pseudoalteromonas luteoviolacea CPMOR-1]